MKLFVIDAFNKVGLSSFLMNLKVRGPKRATLIRLIEDIQKDMSLISNEITQVLRKYNKTSVDNKDAEYSTIILEVNDFLSGDSIVKPTPLFTEEEFTQLDISPNQDAILREMGLVETSTIPNEISKETPSE
jgi:arsenate reductase-like glutaredoxin family protein